MAVETLKGKSITKVCAGDGFSVFASDNGIVMTCGDGSSGCLGHGDWNSTAKPKLLGNFAISSSPTCTLECNMINEILII